ncbi:MAG TPA: hypothetical protein DCM08_06040 [Microscillaceae bacterium]|nr:hypothetical protein [Microscillaceae bacterium]
MKPLKLTIEAFGPFSGAVEIDFERLAQAHLFVITGATGAGKTSILDALCFALYGETTNNQNRSYEKMLSTHAPEGTVAKVSLVFEAQHRIFFVERSFWPTKSRQSNTEESLEDAKQKISTKQTFYELDPTTRQPSESPLSKTKEIESRIEQLIGFGIDNFRYLVVLPQGKFQELLQSNSDKKEDILMEVFDAKIYEKLVDKLIEGAKQREANSKALRDEIKHFFADHYQLTDLPNFEEGVTHIGKRRTATLAELDKLEKQKPAIEKKYLQADAAYKEGIELQDLFQQLVQLQQAKQVHLQQAELIQNHQAVLEKHRQALPLKGSLDSFNGLKKEYQQRLLQLVSPQEAKEKGINQITQQLLSKIPPREAVEKLFFEKEKLLEIGKRWQQLATQKQQAAQQERLYREAQRLAEGLQKKIETIAAAQKELQMLIDQQLAKLSTKPQAVEQWELLKKQQETRQQYQKLQHTLEQQQGLMKQTLQALKQAREEEMAAKQQVDTLKNHWMQSQAAVLALQLEEGQPCPVCGSAQHPNPALPQHEDLRVDEKTLAQADKTWQQALQKATSLEESYRQQEAKQKDYAEENNQLRQRYADWQAIWQMSEAEFEQYQSPIVQLKQSLDNVEAHLQETQQKSKQLRENEQQEREAFQAAQLREQAQKEAWNQLTTTIQTLQTTIPDTFQTEQQVQEALDKIQAKMNQVAQLQDLGQLWKQFSKTKDELDIKVAEAGFVDLKTIQESLLDETSYQQRTQSIEQWNKQGVVLNTQIQGINKKINGRTAPTPEGMAATEKAAQELKNELEELQLRSMELQLEADQTEKHLAKVTQLLQSANDALSQYQPWETLSRVADGHNPRSLKFVSFVLATLLGEVLAFANQRLDLLSDGRYRLLLSGAKEKNARKIGLNLDVFDAYNGTTRSVKTLSGGETFLASLALALGLADVAAAQLGGVKLEAIFIDEGFGSLDEETLQVAIKTLSQLEIEHRMIGIISHVNEIKQMSVPKIQVDKGPQGSLITIKNLSKSTRL